MRLALKVLSEKNYPDEIFRLPEKAGTHYIGRGEGNDLVVEEATVSSTHASIEVSEKGAVILNDKGSSNGTFVNGDNIESQVLTLGDMVSFSSASFRVIGIDEAERRNAEANGEVQLALVRKELAAAVAEAAHKEKEIQRLQSELRESQDAQDRELRFAKELQEVQAREQQLLDDLKSAGEREEALKEEVSSTRATELGLRDELRGIHEQMVELKEAAKDAEARQLSLDDDLNQVESRNLALSDELKQATGREVARVRDLRESEGREEKLKKDLTAARNVELGLEGNIATLKYELTRREESLCQREQEIDELSASRDDLQRKCSEFEVSLDSVHEELSQSKGREATASEKIDKLVTQVRKLSERFASDWKHWLHLDDEAEPAEEEAVFARFEEIREQIRGELDLIEPIWKKHGQRVQDELRGRRDRLQEECDAMSAELVRKKSERDGLGKDLLKLRKEVDEEVRRAQGLSRKGMAIEIPERFEAMVIAREEEQRVYQDLIEGIEAFDQMLESYRGNRKMRDAMVGLEGFRHRLHSLLEAHGVQPFELEPGTGLTPKHRKQAKVLGKKGWGTKEYIEKPFQPGEISKVVRPGYCVGEGEGAVILRKVEVLICEAEV